MLQKGKFLFSLYKNDPKTMSDVLYRATIYMNAEDPLWPERRGPRREKDKRTHDRIEGRRWRERENGGMIGVQNSPPGSSQALPH